MTGSRAQSGMTLVEVMIVVAIIGIMASIAVPSFRGTMPRVKLSNNTTLLANEIAVARMRAISQGVRFCVIFHTGTDADISKRNSYVLKKENAGGICSSTAGTLISTNQLSGTVLVSANGFKIANTLIVDGTGTMNIALNASAYLELQTPDGESKRCVLVAPNGRARTGLWTGGIPPCVEG